MFRHFRMRLKWWNASEFWVFSKIKGGRNGARWEIFYYWRPHQQQFCFVSERFQWIRNRRTFYFGLHVFLREKVVGESLARKNFSGKFDEILATFLGTPKIYLLVHICLQVWRSLWYGVEITLCGYLVYDNEQSNDTWRCIYWVTFVVAWHIISYFVNVPGILLYTDCYISVTLSRLLQKLKFCAQKKQVKFVQCKRLAWDCRVKGMRG